MTKQNIINEIKRIITALNTVHVVPGKDNWLNQGGAIAMLESACDQIDKNLTDICDEDPLDSKT